jgi:hypothetical protein
MQSAKSVIFHPVLTTTRACFDACRAVGIENKGDRNSLTLLTTLIAIVKAILGIGLGGTSPGASSHDMFGPLGASKNASS